MKKPTRWHVSGKDQNGGHWEGYLVVESDPDAFFTTGFFEWCRENTGGRYRFAGTFDKETRAVRWTGFNIEDRFGVPCNAIYQAILSDDEQRLTDGSWAGGISVPGTWKADFVGEL